MAIFLITGGTGMVGKELTGLLLREDHEVIVLTRSLPKSKPGVPGLSYATWDVQQQTIDAAAIGRADHIIHLAGAGVADQRWTEERKKEIVDSRVRSSGLIVKALTEIPNRVQTVISASAIGWYGPDTDETRQNGFTEEAPPDHDFLGETCRRWEESIGPVEKLGKRLIKLRTGIVLSNKGGALAEFTKPLKAGLATILGNGQQVVSWIHVEDLCKMYLYAALNEKINGVYNAVAPQPVTNKELIKTIAKQMRGKWYITTKVPAFALKIALGEMSIEVLKSATVSASKIAHTGFHFKYPSLLKALEQLVG